MDESLRTMLARSGTEPDYTMGSFQKETGIAAETLRSWELRYDFPTPARTASNHRLYSERDIVAVRWLLDKTRDGNQSISTAIGALKRQLPSEDTDSRPSESPLNYLVAALKRNDLVDAQSHWDQLAVGLSPGGIGQVLLHLHASTDVSDRARAFLLRKAIVLLDAACPDRGETPVAVITSGQPEAMLPAVIAAADLARRNCRVLTPFPSITSLTGIGAVTEFAATHVILVEIEERDASTLRAILPNVSIHGWDSRNDPLETILVPGASRS